MIEKGDVAVSAGDDPSTGPRSPVSREPDIPQVVRSGLGCSCVSSPRRRFCVQGTKRSTTTQ
jgi:hypothetical protein